MAAPVSSTSRDLDGAKAQRIVDAMREQVAARGASGATFDHVARAAGVSRGLLHYYFGTKEKLLAEAVRRDCELRLERMRESFGAAHTAQEVVDALALHLARFLAEERETNGLVYEFFAVSRRHEEIRAEMRRLYEEIRTGLAGLLAAKQAEGVLRLAAPPEAVASLLLALADGAALQILSDPEWDARATVAGGLGLATVLLDGTLPG